VQGGEQFPNHPDEELIRRAVRGALDPNDRTALERHLAGCPTCAAELEARRIFQVSLARDREDDARDRDAVERAMAHVAREAASDTPPSGTDEDLDRVALDGAMARLGERKTSHTGTRRFVRAAIGFAALGAAAAAAIAFAVSRTPRTTTATATTGSATSTRPLVLADGSEIVSEDAGTPIQIAEETPVRTTVRLSAGAARFRVRHDVRRLFRVDAGSIEIEDLGTVFRVAHEAEGRVRVTVSEGRVAVVGALSRLRVELGPGDDRVFSATAAPRDPVERPSEATPSEGPKAAVAPVRGSIYAQSRAHGVDDPAGLLAAADVARRSRLPRDAVAPLRRLVERYPKDPRAPSAAFTLGWVLLTDLNRPREAAIAFADAERIAPRGALAEDAAARVAEAWQNAGEPRRAAAAARHYAQMYPTGRYIALMRGLIGEH
jgi:ferric-dicitrate binding protein FerR (iron transport regulator)